MTRVLRARGRWIVVVVFAIAMGGWRPPPYTTCG